MKDTGSSFSLLHMDIQFPSTICFKEAVLSPMYVFDTLVKKSVGCRCVDLFQSSLFCPVFHVCFYANVIATLLLWLEIRYCDLSALFFLLKIALAIWGSFGFHMHFRITFSISVKNVIIMLIGVALNF